MEWRQEGGDRLPPQFRIQNECAQLNERRPRPKPDSRRDPGHDVRSCGAALDARPGRRAVHPDESDMEVGRERPPVNRAWGEEGGSQVGVAHALVVSGTGIDTCSDWDTGGIERRPQTWRSPTVSMIWTRRFVLYRQRRITFRRADRFPVGGNGPPAFAFPHLVPLACRRHPQEQTLKHRLKWRHEA